MLQAESLLKIPDKSTNLYENQRCNYCYLYLTLLRYNNLEILKCMEEHMFISKVKKKNDNFLSIADCILKRPLCKIRNTNYRILLVCSPYLIRKHASFNKE